MLREISEDVRVALKDRLRDIRHTVRCHRHDAHPSAGSSRGERMLLPRPPIAAREFDVLLGHAVSAFDDAMTLAEKFAPVDRPAPDGVPRVRRLGDYFAGTDEAGARAFRRDLYYLARQILSRRGVGSARIHEAGFAAVHAAMKTRRAPLIAALSADLDRPTRVSAASAACAALLVELLDHQPLGIDSVELPAGEIHKLEVLCLTPLVLACGFATVDPDLQMEPDLMELASYAAEARLDRILAAAASPNGEEQLASLFAVLLTHLP